MYKIDYISSVSFELFESFEPFESFKPFKRSSARHIHGTIRG